MLTLVDRGADILVSSKRIDQGSRIASRRRPDVASSGEFFGFIAFTTLIAKKPAWKGNT